jgi:hypothetical protein
MARKEGPCLKVHSKRLGLFQLLLKCNLVEPVTISLASEEFQRLTQKVACLEVIGLLLLLLIFWRVRLMSIGRRTQGGPSSCNAGGMLLASHVAFSCCMTSQSLAIRSGHMKRVFPANPRHNNAAVITFPFLPVSAYQEQFPCFDSCLMEGWAVMRGAAGQCPDTLISPMLDSFSLMSQHVSDVLRLI